MRTLALDWGERRIGVAISDPTGLIAQPLETIPAHAGGRDALERIAELVRSHEVGEIVVGLPVHMNGRSGPEAAKARAFGERVRSRAGVAVEYLDERWTSVEAERALAESGMSRREQRGKVDPVAAAILLRTWLEMRRK
ncbi:MAG TPA: Holliday junction resolvase RuvX [Myxococcota bacterium]|nr:Holliday junction resolvase RuvX [Myxococcota bacterium]